MIKKRPHNLKEVAKEFMHLSFSAICTKYLMDSFLAHFSSFHQVMWSSVVFV